MSKVSAEELSLILHGSGRAPTAEQAAATEAPVGPALVVAGAGAGKTETMSARAVWLVANELATPDQILGLTFTRKATQELEKRIRHQMAIVAESSKIRDISPAGDLRKIMTEQAAKVATYDSFAGDVIREFGLLAPVEPDSRLITQAELYALTLQVIRDYRGSFDGEFSLATVAERTLELIDALNTSLEDPQEILETSHMLASSMQAVLEEKGRKTDTPKWLEAQVLRKQYFPLVDAVLAELKRKGLTTFNLQMGAAARIARDHSVVRNTLRRRYRVVLLDEYQDTSHSQRVLLSYLFGAGISDGKEDPWAPIPIDPELTVTAVGDPMQGIYGWRGAKAENLPSFVHDFPRMDGPADTLQLTTSWRNPRTVLEMANAVSQKVFFPDGQGPLDTRPVEELQPSSFADDGTVHLSYFADAEDEADAIAELMETQMHQVQAQGKPFTGAVLVRKNSQAGQIAVKLAERNIPHEIVGTGGLLSVPEVADLVALATILVRPSDAQAALRVLAGPIVGLGLADVDALASRVRNLAGVEKTRSDYPEDPVERLKAQLADISDQAPENLAGFADAIADLGERDRYSAEAKTRLEQLSAALRHLRTYSLGKALPDLFADIEQVFHIRTEVQSRVFAEGNNSGFEQTVHLDRFFEVVNDFRNSTVEDFLDYLALAEDKENGLDAGEVTVAQDRVQIMTVHKSKGLEWDVVAVAHADAASYKAAASTFLTNAHKLPDEELVLEEMESAGTRKELEAAGAEFRDRMRQLEKDEAGRLFYVAITRTERVLWVSASEKTPYEHFATLKERFPEHVKVWQDGEEADQGDIQKAPITGTFPHLPQNPAVREAAAMVEAAQNDLPALSSGETFDMWEREVTALIQEWERELAPVQQIEMPAELTATDMVAMKNNPEQFARRRRRPVPFKPNTYAKRGTAFHEWLEDRFDAPSLLSEDELPGIDEEPIDGQQLEDLKEKFLSSQWADRTPAYVEQAFEFSIGQQMVRGRMDAIFLNEDGSWLIIDWKTGRKPQGDELKAAEIQLAVYREAWLQMVGKDQRVEAAFYYVSQDLTFAPADLPDGEALAEILRQPTSPTRDLSKGE